MKEGVPSGSSRRRSDSLQSSKGILQPRLKSTHATLVHHRWWIHCGCRCRRLLKWLLLLLLVLTLLWMLLWMLLLMRLSLLLHHAKGVIVLLLVGALPPALLWLGRHPRDSGGGRL